MKNEKAFTLLELLVSLVIMGIIFSMVVPTFTNSTKNIEEALLYSQFESVYQKAASDAIAESVSVNLVFTDLGYEIQSAKSNRVTNYLDYVTLLEADIGRRIEFDQEGQVVTPISVNLRLREKVIVLRIDSGYQNIFFNDIPLSELQEN